MKSIAMSRIFGVQKKNRVRVNTQIEREFMHVICEHTLDVADTFNVALEKHLRDRGLI